MYDTKPKLISNSLYKKLQYQNLLIRNSKPPKTNNFVIICALIGIIFISYCLYIKYKHKQDPTRKYKLLNNFNNKVNYYYNLKKMREYEQIKLQKMRELAIQRQKIVNHNQMRQNQFNNQMQKIQKNQMKGMFNEQQVFIR